jgi:hypothetical protein
MKGEEQALGLRLDVDNQSILDTFEDPPDEADRQMQEQAVAIWTEVMIGMA